MNQITIPDGYVTAHEARTAGDLPMMHQQALRRHIEDGRVKCIDIVDHQGSRLLRLVRLEDVESLRREPLGIVTDEDVSAARRRLVTWR